jgi:hypothetical protein
MSIRSSDAPNQEIVRFRPEADVESGGPAPSFFGCRHRHSSHARDTSDFSPLYPLNFSLTNGGILPVNPASRAVRAKQDIAFGDKTMAGREFRREL